MKNWRNSLIGPQQSLHDALSVIEKAGCQIALVVDQGGRLLATLSDGDVRRALLKGYALSDKVHLAMHAHPTCERDDENPAAVLSRMRLLGLRQIPLVDSTGVVTGLKLIDDFLAVPRRDNWVVIMAGGLGTRLAELTRNTPKPMLKVGSRPLLETIVRHYADQGFHRFYLAVNFKAEQIMAHLGDGSALGIDIRYLHEQQRMGTAGALSLLPKAPSLPILVTNADLLTKEDYGLMVDRHIEAKADATMAVRDFEMRVPFGVVRASAGRIESIEEKPLQSFVISAGTCILSPSVLEQVPSNQFFDMPSLFDVLIARGANVRTHSVTGYWLDIGQLPDYERANVEFSQVFK